MSTPPLSGLIQELFPDARVQLFGEITLTSTTAYAVDLSLMLFNWRLMVTTPELHGTSYVHGYCYFGRDTTTLHRALAAAKEWTADGNDPLTTHPPMFDKQAY